MLIRYIAIALITLSSSLCFSEKLYVVVSKDSNIEKISTKELKKIFLSLNPHFPNGTKAIPYDLDNRRAYRAFYKAIAGKSRLQMKTFWSEMMFSGKGLPPTAIRDEEKIAKLATENSNLIGYVTEWPSESDLKVVQIITY